jgi:hypothetical protein
VGRVLPFNPLAGVEGLGIARSSAPALAGEDGAEAVMGETGAKVAIAILVLVTIALAVLVFVYGFSFLEALTN